MLDKFEKMGDI